MADISKIQVAGVEYDIKDPVAREALENAGGDWTEIQVNDPISQFAIWEIEEMVWDESLGYEDYVTTNHCAIKLPNIAEGTYLFSIQYADGILPNGLNCGNFIVYVHQDNDEYVWGSNYQTKGMALDGSDKYITILGTRTGPYAEGCFGLQLSYCDSIEDFFGYYEDEFNAYDPKYTVRYKKL